MDNYLKKYKNIFLNNKSNPLMKQVNMPVLLVPSFMVRVPRGIIEANSLIIQFYSKGHK